MKKPKEQCLQDIKNNCNMRESDPLMKKIVISEAYAQAIPISIKGEDAKKLTNLTLSVRDALMDNVLQSKTIDKMLNEIVYGAYQNRIEAYATQGSTQEGGRERVQKLRQDADNHLLNVIKMVRDIKKPLINVAVKQAEQVNIANNQVNLKESPNDLDRI